MKLIAVLLFVFTFLTACDTSEDSPTNDDSVVSLDSDNDGVDDEQDAFPNDASETTDTDGDGVGDNADAFPSDDSETTDSDSDGVGDNTDAFPSDDSETTDSDGDGAGDNADAFPNDNSETSDSDGDGVGDNADAFPRDNSETTDSDGDGVGDNADVFPSDNSETSDTDGDGVGDNADAFPRDNSETTDSDGDGVGDNADVFPSDNSETSDTDGDGTGDNADAFPNDDSETTDTDGDGVGDNADAFPSDNSETTDSDGDGVGDNADEFPNDDSETTDTDGDGAGDNADAFPNDDSETTDTDGDGVGDNADVFPNDPTETTDSDGDGIGDNSDDDNTSAYEKPTTYDAVATSIADLETKLSAASANDVIALANGTYIDVELDIDVNNVIVVAETSGSVIIEGTSTIELSGDNIIFEGFSFQNGQPAESKGAIIISGHYNRVTNCKIDHFNDSDPDNDFKWVSLDNDATYGEVDHCTFTGKETEGALLVVWRNSTEAQYHHIYRNIFSDHQYVESEDIGSDNNGWEAIRIGTSTYSQSASYTTVEYNYFYDSNGEIEIISNKSGENIYRYNTFESSSGLLTLRHGTNCTVDSNYFLIDNTSGGGIRIIDEGHTITNNYIEGANSTSSSRGAISLSSSDEDPSLSGYWEVSDVTIANNTVINSQQSLHYGASSKVNPPASANINNNLIRNNIDGDGDHDYINVRENSDNELLDITSPSYSNNYFFGSSQLGLSSVPDGINLTEIDISQNSNGQYYATDSSLNVGASQLQKLTFESDVGCSF